MAAHDVNAASYPPRAGPSRLRGFCHLFAPVGQPLPAARGCRRRWLSAVAPEPPPPLPQPPLLIFFVIPRSKSMTDSCERRIVPRNMPLSSTTGNPLYRVVARMWVMSAHDSTNFNTTGSTIRSEAARARFERRERQAGSCSRKVARSACAAMTKSPASHPSTNITSSLEPSR